MPKDNGVYFFGIFIFGEIIAEIIQRLPRNSMVDFPHQIVHATSLFRFKVHTLKVLSDKWD